jgi:hypothetical protein
MRGDKQRRPRQSIVRLRQNRGQGYAAIGKQFLGLGGLIGELRQLLDTSI